MTDPDKRSVTSSASSSTPSAPTRSGISRPVLWLLLVSSAAGSTATAGNGAGFAVEAAFGAATLGCATALIIQHYRNRRR